jgi:tetratricopeptide (TPR) repeat protein
MGRQRHALILRREDHKRDALGAVFLGAVSDGGEIRRYVERYLGPTFQVRAIEAEGGALRIDVECARFEAEARNLARIAEALAAQSRPRAAAETFDEALKLDPLSTDSLRGRAALHAEAGELVEAEDKWIRAAEIRGYDADLLKALAKIALAGGRAPSAMQYLEEALVADPADDEARTILMELRRQAKLRFEDRGEGGAGTGP